MSVTTKRFPAGTQRARTRALTLFCRLALTLAGCGDPDPERDHAHPDVVDAGPDLNPTANPDPGNTALPPVTEMRAQPLMQSMITDLWGLAPDDMYAVGGWGIAHFDGSNWTFAEIDGALPQATDIHGFSNGDIYVAAEQLWHFDGTGWSALDLGNESRISDVWGSGPNDVYAVGWNFVLHYDGISWMPVAAAVPKDCRYDDVALRVVVGSGPSDVFVGGQCWGGPTKLMHFSGTGWSEVAVPDTLIDLHSGWSAGPTQTFFGHGGSLSSWNGSTLRDLRAGLPNYGVRSLWGVSANEVYAAVGGGQILRFNGYGWLEIERPFPEQTAFDTRSIFGFGGNDLWVAGTGLYRFDGLSYETLVEGGHVNALWAAAPDDVRFFGSNVYRYDGANIVREDLGELTYRGTHAAWGPPDHLVAVGRDGQAILYDGIRWGLMTTNSTQELNGVWGSSNDNIFAVGEEGTILEFNGATWGGQISGTNEDLHAVWGTGPNNVYAVGDAGIILHFDGNRWTRMESGTTAPLTNIVGFDESTILIGFEGGLLLGNGASWAVERIEVGGAPQEVYSVVGPSPDDLFIAVGPRGEFGSARCAHYDRSTVTPLDNVPCHGPLLALDERELLSLDNFSGRSLFKHAVR